MVDLRAELCEAFEASGLTYENLKANSGIQCKATSLFRKLNGLQPIGGREGAALARALELKRADAVRRVVEMAEALGATLSWPSIQPPSPKKRAA